MMKMHRVPLNKLHVSNVHTTYICVSMWFISIQFIYCRHNFVIISFLHCPWRICYGIFQFCVSLLTDGMWHLFHSLSFYFFIFILKKIQCFYMNLQIRIFSHLYRFSCISFLVLRHIRISLLWLLMQFCERLFNAKLLLKFVQYYFIVFPLYFFNFFFHLFRTIECASKLHGSIGQTIHWIHCIWDRERIPRMHTELYSVHYTKHTHTWINSIIMSTMVTINTKKKNEIIMYGIFSGEKSSSSSK